MKCIIILLLFGCYPAFLLAQTGIIVKGKIYNGSNHTLLPNANIILANTTFGAKSQQNGAFTISNIPFGSYDIVASYVGYQFQSISFKSYKDTTIEIYFLLEPMHVKLKQVDVVADSPDEWKQNLKIFTKEFIGNTDNAELTKILNPEVISLTSDIETNILYANSDSIVVVENRALGYRLEVFIVNIEYELIRKKFTFSYYTRFMELPGDEKEKKKWKRNRECCYLGSQKHFFRSMFFKNLEKDNYKIYSGSLNSLLIGLGIWTSPNSFELRYNADSTIA